MTNITVPANLSSEAAKQIQAIIDQDLYTVKEGDILFYKQTEKFLRVRGGDLYTLDTNQLYLNSNSIGAYLQVGELIKAKIRTKEVVTTVEVPYIEVLFTTFTKTESRTLEYRKDKKDWVALTTSGSEANHGYNFSDLMDSGQYLLK